MPKFYTQAVFEERTYRVDYVVEAENDDEAEEKISIGDTLSEHNAKLVSINSRKDINAVAQCPEDHFSKRENKELLAAMVKIIAGYGECFQADEGIDEAVCEKCAQDLIDKLKLKGTVA